MDETKYADVEIKLQGMRSMLVSLLEAGTKEFVISSTRSADLVDNSEERNQREIRIQCLLVRRQELENIERALVRIRTGEYGACRGCKNKIDPRRLEALPFAIHCVKCQEKLTKKPKKRESSIAKVTRISSQRQL